MTRVKVTLKHNSAQKWFDLPWEAVVELEGRQETEYCTTQYTARRWANRAARRMVKAPKTKPLEYFVEVEA